MATMYVSERYTRKNISFQGKYVLIRSSDDRVGHRQHSTRGCLSHNRDPRSDPPGIIRSLAVNHTSDGIPREAVDRESEDPWELGDKIRRLDVSRASPEELAQLVRAALKSGLLVDAHWLAAQAHAVHPDHEDLSHLAHLLGPPKRVGPPVPASPSTKANYDWLITHVYEYRHQWVALKDGELLASAGSYQEILERLDSSSGVFITRV